MRLRPRPRSMTPSRWDMAFAAMAWPALEARSIPLVLPRAARLHHPPDGQPDRRSRRYFQDHPGVYYRSTGWVERGADLEPAGPQPRRAWATRSTP